jgi:putative DNA primase/helicase
MHSAVAAPRLNADEIRERARGHWPSILSRLAIHVPSGPMKHGPCPACVGTDRFRFDDKDGRGTWFCNQCSPQAGKALTW